MNKATELFKKIYVDNVEIDLAELDANNGKFQVGQQKQSVNVKFIMKDEVNEIPEKLFADTTMTAVNVMPKEVVIAEDAFEGLNLPQESQEEIDKVKYGVYTEEEANEYNYELNGALKYGTLKPESYITDYPIEYIHDQQSWEDSYNDVNGLMYKYYETYPDNDLIAEDGEKVAGFNDRRYYGTISGENEEKRFRAVWSEKSQQLIKQKFDDQTQKYIDDTDTPESYYIKRLDETSEYYGTADEWKAQYIKFHGMSWQLYSDALLTTPVEGKEIYIRTLQIDGFIHTYAALVANGGILPWIGAMFNENFTEEDGVKIIFNYEGKESVMPWGDRVFGKGEDQKVWGFASVPTEFNDNTLATIDCHGDGLFDDSKFSLVLEKVNSVAYTDAEVNAYNAELTGAIHAGDIKYPESEQTVLGKYSVENNGDVQIYNI